MAARDSEALGARPRLLTPGPAEVPRRLRAAAVADVHHHSTAAYHAIEEQVREGLAEVMGTGGEVVLLPAPGTGAVEAATRSLFRPGESVLVVRSGRFGERWADQCEAAGLRVRHLDVEWGESVTQARLEAALRGEPFDGVCVVHGETSTGARADLSMVGSCIVGRALLVVDAIGTLGLDELRMDAWSVDAAVGAAQKGLLGFPGLSWVALGPRARERAARAGTDAYYLDLDRHLRAMRNGTHVCTPAIVQTVGLRESLEELRAYGWTEVLRRVQALSEAFRRSAAAVGLEPLCRSGRMNGLTVLTLPQSVAAAELVAVARDAAGVLFADGLGSYKGRSLRAMFTAAMSGDAVAAAAEGLESGLLRAGSTVTPGVAVAAAIGALPPWARPVSTVTEV